MPRAHAPTLQYMLARTKLEDSCWLWTSTLLPNGYGSVGPNPAGSRLAHRYIYELVLGPIDPSLTLDHLCRNRACINPLHLEPVPNTENIARGLGNQYRSATHCVHGHEFTEENTYVTPSTGARQCRTCLKQNASRHKAAWRARQRNKENE